MSEAIDEFAATTTIHGVQTFLISKRRWFKVIWGLLMVMSTAAMVVQLYQTSKEFFRAPVISSTSMGTPDQWPIIRICPDEWFNSSKAFDAGFNAADVQIIRKVLGVDSVVSIFDFIGERGLQESLTTSAYLSERKTVFEQIMAKENLITIQDMVELIVDDVVKPLWQNDSGRLVKAPFPYDHRVCFHSSDVPPEYDYLEFLIDSGGFFTVTRNPSSLGKKYEFKTQDFVIVGMVMEGTSILPRTNNQCILDMEEMTCKETCNLEYRRCMFSPSEYPHMFTLGERFDSLVGFNADILTSRNYTQLGEKCDKEIRKCIKGCISCTTWKFEIEKQDWKGNGPENGTYIRFEMNQRMKMIRECWAYTGTMLVSNVGGLVSLYLGASILSVAHLGFYCFSRCFDKKPQEVMAAEEGRISPVKERKKGCWTKLICPFSRKKSVERPASAPWVLHVSNFNKDCVIQT